jgi:hypothetical protein
MAKLRINGDSSGYVDLEAPNAASSSTIDLDQVPQKNATTTGFTGNMGVGISTPSTTASGYDGGNLHVHNSGTGSSLRLTNSTTGTGTSAGMLFSKWSDSNTYLTNFDNGANTIFTQSDSSGTLQTTMKLHGDGYVTTPNQPSFYAYGSPNGSIATSSTYASPTFNQTGHNIGGHFNTSTERFTAPVAGLYFFHLNVYWNATNGYSRMRIEKNGSTIDHYNMKPGTGGDHTQQVFGVVQMAVNDYVLGQVQSDQSNSYFRARNHTFFEGYLLG